MILVQWNNIHACPPPPFTDLLLQHLQSFFLPHFVYHLGSGEVLPSSKTMSENHFTKLLHHLLKVDKNIIIYKIYPKESHHFFFFLFSFCGVNYGHLVTKKNQVRLIPTRIFVKRKVPKLPDFQEFVFLGLPYLDNCLQVVAKNRVLPKVTLFLGLLLSPLILSFE